MSTIKIHEATAGPVASRLLKIGAIRLNYKQPFTWSSGWKSPIYCDNRLALSYPEIRTYIKENLAQVIRQNFPQVAYIAGVATAGIPQGALVADFLGLPFVYVRPKPKEHGMGNLIEGKIESGAKVVLIEDLISTGMSSLQAVEAIRQVPAQVVGVLAIFQYGMPKATQAFEKAECPFHTLTDFQTIIQVAADKQIIEHAHLELLRSWSADPQAWSDNYMRTH